MLRLPRQGILFNSADKCDLFYLQSMIMETFKSIYSQKSDLSINDKGALSSFAQTLPRYLHLYKSGE